MSLEKMLGRSGEKVFLLGNEAIARGALEASVDVFAAYPGTPASEIADRLYEACEELRGKYDFRMEYSANEKVAVEVAIGASLSGKRGMAAMKHVGVNVAADALFSFSYIGAKGGFVLISADDPFMHSSQDEQDNRWYGKSAYIPVLEPSNPQEAKDMVPEAFHISERFNTPVMLRTVTRLNHSCGIVELGEIPRKKIEKVEWVKDPKREVTLPENARELRISVLEREKEIEEFFNQNRFNQITEPDSDSDFGIIAGGNAYRYVPEALESLDLDAKVLKLSTIHPLPEKLIRSFLLDVEKVMIVEEVDPFIEMHVRSLLQGEDGRVEVRGKLTGDLPRAYEYNVDVVEDGLRRIFGKEESFWGREKEETNQAKEILPPRPPVLCPGCPHTAVFYSIKNVFGPLAAYPSDIGCYTLGINPPLEAVDICICMGAGGGVANGLSYTLKNDIVVTAGDSTFFHAYLPALVNAVYNKHNFTLIVLDNRTTAMTGFQPHPGVGGNGIAIEKVAEGIGVKHIEVVDPYDLKETQEALKRAKKHKGISVIVARRPCVILWNRERKRKGISFKPLRVNDNCKLCLKCVQDFSCPAIFIEEEEGGDKVRIDESLCNACGVCMQVCPNDAIERSD